MLWEGIKGEKAPEKKLGKIDMSQKGQWRE
jgi:hypothetical protein